MSIRVIQNSFSKGILSPSLQGRIDLEQYNLGLKKLNNGIILQEGCVQNRAGLEFLVKTKYDDKKVRLFPFVFNFDQNYVIEAGENYFRFIKDGGYILNEENEIYEVETPYAWQDLFEINYTQKGDIITFTQDNYPPYNLTRIKHNDWLFEKVDFKSSIEPPKNISLQYTGSTQSNTKTYSYVVCSVDKTTNEESARSEAKNIVAHKEAYWTTAEFIKISWQEVKNALEYNIYKASNGIFGYIGTTNNLSFIDDNIEPDLSAIAPIYQNPFDDTNPSTVCYYQQRKVYAGSNNSPQTIWASQTGTNDNFNISRPLNSTDSITATISDNSSGKIKHLIPFDDLIVMTDNAEWSINGSDGVFSANPAPVAKLQSYYGASSIKPAISGSMVLFVQSGGNIVRDLGYNYLSNSYDGDELTLLANHLFEGKKIVDMAYSKEKQRILWCVLDDGTINALTYNRNQKISAWHTHTTKGEFESVTVIRENNEDVPYFSIKRQIDGKAVRYIERLTTRIINSIQDCVFLDCAVKQTFENKVKKITNLYHLKNENVSALLDCGVVENLKVDKDGVVELPYEAKNITIGIPYSFEIETLNLEGQGTLGLKKIINKVEIKILNSREEFKVQNDNNTSSTNIRSKESVDFPNKLFSKDVEFCVLNNPSWEASIKILQDKPLPLTILSIAATISLQEAESV